MAEQGQQEVRCAPALLPLLLLVGCSDSSSHAVVESPVEPVEEPEEEPEEEPCDEPIIYQQLIFVAGREVVVVLPFEYDGWVSAGEETTHIKQGGEWRSDYSTTHGSVSVSVTAEHSGGVDCPQLGDSIKDVVTLPRY